jgi:hypothetical protein
MVVWRDERADEGQGAIRVVQRTLFFRPPLPARVASSAVTLLPLAGRSPLLEATAATTAATVAVRRA